MPRTHIHLLPLALAGMLLSSGVCSAGWLHPGSAGASGWFVDGRPNVPADDCTYPVFRLDLGGPWTDFMIKGSVDNFATVCYLVSSSVAIPSIGDTNVLTYFVDDYADDPRKWVSSPPAVPILSQMVDPVNGVISSVIVCPSHQCDKPWGTWMRPDNPRLVWCYLRMAATGYETNTTGQVSANRWSCAAHWHPVQPIAWRKQRITP